MTEYDNARKLIRIRDQAPFSLEPRKTALLVIDMQRYFVRPEYALAQLFEKLVPGLTTGYFDRVRRIVAPNIKRLQECFRSQRSPIIYTAVGTCTGDGRDLAGWLKEVDSVGIAVLGQRIYPAVNDPSWQIDESVAPLPGELVVNKTSSGPLNSTKLDQTLHNLGIESLVVTGLTTDVCVTQTAREMADSGFQVVVAEDACTTIAEEMHRVPLDVFALVFGRVRKTEDLIRLLSAVPAS